jgi:hypothetical protein
MLDLVDLLLHSGMEFGLLVAGPVLREEPSGFGRIRRRLDWGTRPKPIQAVWSLGFAWALLRCAKRWQPGSVPVV